MRKLLMVLSLVITAANAGAYEMETIEITTNDTQTVEFWILDTAN